MTKLKLNKMNNFFAFLIFIIIALFFKINTVNAVTYQNKSSESILKWALEDTSISNNAYYNLTVNGKTYKIHTYSYNGNQEWTGTKTFGDSGDIGTASTNAVNMVLVIVRGDLVVNSGCVVQPYYTSYGGPKGFGLVVTGSLTNYGNINNNHGAKAAGEAVYLWKNSSGTYDTIPATGGTGGTLVKSSSKLSFIKGNDGNPGSSRGTGGGGSGNVTKGNNTGTATSGAGGQGTSYSGGAGGGGAGATSGTSVGTAGSSVGGAGGAGKANSGSTASSYYSHASGGGAGNPGGAGSIYKTSQSGNTPSVIAAGNGTGGLMLLYAETINNVASAKITANGSTGGKGDGVSYRSSGGGSGGGSLNIYTAALNNSGTITASGGTGPTDNYSKAGNGGNGTVTVTNLVLNPEYAHPTLSSLTVDKGTLEPEFDPQIKKYFVSLSPDEAFVNIEAILAESSNTLIGSGVYSAPKGTSTHIITITSKFGVVENYEIEFYREPNSYRYLENIKIDGNEIVDFNPETLMYNVTVPYNSDTINIEPVKGSGSQEVFGGGEISTLSGNNTYILTVISEDGVYTTYYTLNIYREHSSKLKSLNIDGYDLNPTFDPETLTYTVALMSNAMSANVAVTTYDEEATYSLSGFGYIKNTQTGKITVKEPNCEPTVYTVDIIKEGSPTVTSFKYDYTGKYQTFVAPATGFYKIELWGAQGGNAVGSYNGRGLSKCSYNRGNAYGGTGCGGFGAYTSGVIKLKKDEVLYVYVGQRGLDGAAGKDKAGGWNGGGNSTYDHNDDESSGSGGGATDIRLVPTSTLTTWNEFNSLKSRIMVAAGGGGGSDIYAGGNAGALQSEKNRFSSNATQVSGYAFGYGENGVFRKANKDVAGGGAGYFGGYSTAASSSYYDTHGQTGTGGSSYVSGCSGCKALLEESTDQSDLRFSTSGNHYSDYVFSDITMLAGGNSMPTKTAGYSVGNVSNGYAQITMLPQPSENNYLASLKVVVNGEVRAYTPDFNMDAEEQNYSLNVATTETKATIQVKLEDQKAKVLGNGEVVVLAGENVYPITVIAESGATKIYNVHITREADENPYPEDIIISGLVPSLCNANSDFCKLEPARFNKDEHTYELTVPSRIKQLWFNVEKGHEYQVVSGEGKISLAVEENEITIDVLSEAGAIKRDNGEELVANVDYTRYKYIIKRDMTGNTDLETLNILDPEFDIGYDPDILEYYAVVPNEYTTYQLNTTNIKDTNIDNVLQIYVDVEDKTIEGQHIGATFNVTGPEDSDQNKILNVGMNEIKIEVTASNGEKKMYILHVYREQSKNTYLTKLEVKNGETNYIVAPVFNKANIGPYKTTVGNEIENVNVVVAVEEATTTVEMKSNGTSCNGLTCNINLKTGTNKIEVITTAENSNIKEKYILEIYREKNNNAYLNSLTVKVRGVEQVLTPTTNPFNKEEYEYNLEVEEGLETVEILATAEKNTTQIKYLDGNTIKVGENTKRIMTIAEDGTSKLYVVKIKRPAYTNNYLSNLEVKNGETTYELTKTNEEGEKIGKGYEKTHNTYFLEVENDIKQVNVIGTKENALSSVKGNGMYYLSVGENEVIITVTAENGDINNYTLNIVRKPNANAYLSNITTTSGIIITNHEDTTYELEINANTNKVKITGIAEEKTTKVIPTSEEIETPTWGEYIRQITTLAEDGETTLTYTLKINKLKSNNNKIKNLIMEEGIIKPSFNPINANYTAKVARNVESGTFHVELEDARATYEIKDNTFEIGENTVTIVVTAEDGSTKEYYVVVTRQELTSSYLTNLVVTGSITNDNYELNPSFEKEKLYYEVNVPYEETKVNISVVKEDSDATVTGTGLYTLNIGENLVELEITNLAGQSLSYQVKITRASSPDARLNTLILKGVNLTPSFNKDTYEYTLSTTEKELEFTSIVPIEKDATYEIIGNRFDENKEYEVIIRVTAPDKEHTKDYVLKTTKEPSNNNNLKTLKVLGYEIEPSFTKNKTLYTLSVGNDVNSVLVESESEDEKATVVGTGAYTLNVGRNEIVVEVISESGKIKSYVVVVTKEGSPNNNADNITVKNGVMNPIFDGRDSYEVEVPYEEESLELEVILESDTATYSVTNNKLQVGDTDVFVMVTAENGDVKTYTLHVTRKEIVTALLKDIKIKDYELSPKFNSNILNYEVTVAYEIDELEITPIPLDKNATWEIIGNENLEVGEQEITIKVTSSDGEQTETYKINVIKQPYANTYLDYLYTSRGDVTPTFESTKMEYSINVENDVEEIEIYCDTVDKSSTVEGCSNDNGEVIHQLQTGENKIKLTVRSASGVKREYFVTVNRGKSDKNYLETLIVTVNGVTKELTPEFDMTKEDGYTLNVEEGLETILLEGTVSEKATVSGLGTVEINGGENEVKISVTAEDGSVRTYTIVVNRAKSSNNYLIELIPSVGELEPDFGYEEREYTINLDSSAAFLSFDVVTEDRNAKVDGLESEVVPDGTSTREITVTAEDGSVRKYIITINKERTDNALLESLSVTGYELSPTFDKDSETRDYYISVPNDKKVLLASEVTAKAVDKNAKITKGNNINLTTTKDNVYTVSVTAPDGFTKEEYRIHIERGKSKEAQLNNLVVNTGYLTKTFNPNITTYDWKVPKGSIITDASTTVTTSDPNARVVKTEELVMTALGPNVYEVMVISEDGTNSITYTLNVSYDLSVDATLKELVIDKGTYTPAFDSETYIYDVYEYEDEAEIEVTGIPTSETSEVTSGNGVIEIEDGDIHEIVVTAESGAIETYKLRIHKTIKRSEGLNYLGLNGLEEMDCINGKCIMKPTFTKEVIEYNIKVPYEYENLDIIYEKESEDQTVKYKINEVYVTNYKLPVGKTTVKVEVYDGLNKLTRTYTINVERCKSNNNYLKTLKFKGKVPSLNNIEKEYEIEPGFDKTKQEYTVYVENEVEEVEIIAESEDKDARVDIGSYLPLDVGNNDAKIEVKAADGSIRTYVLHVVKAALYNSELKNITVSTGIFWDLSPKFKSGIYEYKTTVPSTSEKATVEAVPVASDTRVTGTGEYELKTGINIVRLVATAKDGTSTTYKITIIREESANVDIKNLIVEEGSLNPSFSKEKTRYEVTVPNRVESLTMHVTLEDKTSSYIVTGNNHLITGDNTVNIIVTNSTKTASKTYQIIVHKLKDDNNILSKIEVYDCEDENKKYAENGDNIVVVPHDVEKVNILVEKESATAQVKGDGIEYLSYGLNTKIIEVTAENGDKNYYTVIINREYNLNLKNLTSDIGVWDKEYSKEEDKYTLNLGKDEEEVVIYAQAESDKVTVKGTGRYEIEKGEQVYTIVVEAPDKTHKDYEITIKRAKDDNNYIKNLQVEGMITPTFAKEVESYEVDVRKERTTLRILDVELESKYATYEIKNNSLGEINEGKEVIIEVTAENGDKREYKLNVYRRPDEYFSNRLLSLTISEGKLTPDFNPDINNYAVTVANSISEVTIETIKENEYAQVSGDGRKSLQLGRNVVDVVVTSKDGLSTNTYTVVIYREENADATLKSLIVKDQNYLPTFSKQEENYTLTVSGETKELEIEAIPTDPNARVTISGHKMLTTGINTVTIKVTAPDGVTTKTYTIMVTKSLSKNNFLKSLEVAEYPFYKVFNKLDQGPYTINVDSKVNSILVKAESEVVTSTVTNDGVHNLQTGHNVITVDVTAEDGSVRTYTIIVNRALSSDSTLKDIILSDGELDKQFNPEILEYEVEVEEDVEEITITGIVNDPLSQVEGNGTYKLEGKETTIKLKVTSEDKNSTTYTVKVIRKIESSSKLSRLVVKNGEIYPKFHRLITSYTILVPNEVTSLDLEYTKEDEEASAELTGNENFRVGTNTVKIHVVSKDETTETDYIINVVRQVSSSNYLRTLEVEGYTLHPEFDKEKLYYEVTVPMEVDTVKIKATLEDETSTITGPGIKYLNPGENRFYVTVESQSGIIRTYQILINRTESSENKLLTLETDVGVIKPAFDADSENRKYTIEVPEKTREITLSGTASENTEVVGLGKSNVVLGSQTRTISVTSQSGHTNTYEIEIIRPASKNTELESLIPSIGDLGYTNDETEYTMEVSDNTSVISFVATPKDADAQVVGTGIQTLNYGDNLINIVVTAEDGIETRTITINVVRKKDLNSITVSEKEIYIEIDEAKEITYTLDPIDTSYQDVEWSSKDNEIATVSEGKIKGNKYGDTEIKVVSTKDESIYDTVVVHVINKKITSNEYEVNHINISEEELANMDESIRPEAYVIGVEPKTNLSEFLSKFTNNPSTLHVYKQDGLEVLNDEVFISTFMKIKLIINEVVYDEVTIVVRGDLNGDGLITVTDYVKLKNKLLKDITFNYIENQCAELSGDGLVTVTDYVKLKSYLLKDINSVN